MQNSFTNEWTVGNAPLRARRLPWQESELARNDREILRAGCADSGTFHINTARWGHDPTLQYPQHFVPRMSLRGAKRRGNLCWAISRLPKLFRRKRTALPGDCHGRKRPRNDTFVTKCSAGTIPSVIKMRNDYCRTIHALPAAARRPRRRGKSTLAGAVFVAIRKIIVNYQFSIVNCPLLSYHTDIAPARENIARKRQDCPKNAQYSSLDRYTPLLIK